MAYTTYRFKTGDSLPKIAQQFGVTSQQLMKANQGLYRPTAGTTVRVPTPQPITGGRYSPHVPTAGTLGAKPFGARGVGFTPSTNPVININTGAYYSTGLGFTNSKSILPQEGIIGGKSTLPSIATTGFITPASGTGSGFAIGQNPLAAPVSSNSALPWGDATTNPQGWRDYWNASAAAGRDLAGRGDNNDFPGFWGGGKNGQHYKSLREARIATRRRQQMKGLGSEPVAPVDPKITTGQTSDYSLTWRVG